MSSTIDTSIFDDKNNSSIYDDDNLYPSSYVCNKIIQQIFDTENNKQDKSSDNIKCKDKRKKNIIQKFREFIKNNKPTYDFINENPNLNIPENNFIFYLTELIRFFDEKQKYRKFAFVTYSLNISYSFYFYKSIDKNIYVIFLECYPKIRVKVVYPWLNVETSCGLMNQYEMLTTSL